MFVCALILVFKANLFLAMLLLLNCITYLEWAFLVINFFYYYFIFLFYFFRGHANLLYIVPILVYVLLKRVHWKDL